MTIASAGSGKTTFLVNQALEISVDEKVLITTYTEANEKEIIRMFLKKKGYVPSNIRIQTWFSFLIQHGIKPFQGTFNSILFNENVSGLLLSQGKSGIKRKIKIKGRPVQIVYKEEKEFKQHYFSPTNKIYSDKVSKFVFKCNQATTGEVIDRITSIYSHIYIDEVQDLAGYDLELIKLFFKSKCTVALVGDPRQVTYLTHNESMNGKYKYGRIKQYLEDKCKSLIKDGIDETSLSVSHRNSETICNFSSLLYPKFKKSVPCSCEECRSEESEEDEILLVKKSQIVDYLKVFNPVQLRWDSRTKTDPNYKTMNFGESKGQTFNRVLIYPTEDMEKWIVDHSTELSDGARAKFYVALTRARYSAAIIFDYDDSVDILGTKKFQPNE